jgi:hypothetical protein
MRQLKRENKTFVALIDADEFLNVPNPNWKYFPVLQQQTRRNYRSWTVLEFLRRLHWYKQTSLPCISLPRLRFGPKERTLEKYGNHSLLRAINASASDFVTLRWVWHGELNDHQINKAGKALVDVSKIPSTSFAIEQTDPHRPVRDYCSEDSVWIQNIDSPLVLQHYIGTFEQWSFRSDPRLSRTQELFDSYSTIDAFYDCSVDHWLEDFVNQVGAFRAKELLKGVGKVALLSNHSSAFSEEIYSNLKQSNVSAANVTIIN